MRVDNGRPGGFSGLEDECALWDWARTAGLSATELREVLRESLSAGEGKRLPALSDVAV